ncbi:MAG: putative ABC transporter permease [Lachnospiraceae bacterium]|nr:putative ABC transporter permease [Lachnospiraceae bacterium]
MKKQTSYNNKTNKSILTHMPLKEYLSLLTFYFFTASLCGFLWEVLIFFIKEGHFRNRGFFYGPWLPVYGTGAILMYLLLSKQKRHPVKVFIYSLLIGTSLELVIGWILDYFWDLRYWDYSGYPFHFHGYICLISALGFGIAGVLWICLLSVFLGKFWFRIPGKFRYAVQALLLLLFIADCTAALIFPNTGRGITFPDK